MISVRGCQAAAAIVFSLCLTTRPLKASSGYVEVERESHYGCPIPLNSPAVADVRHVTRTLCQTVQTVAILQASSPYHRQGGEDNDRYGENLNFNFQMHFLMFIMIVTILLINLLIAMMGNTYGCHAV